MPDELETGVIPPVPPTGDPGDPAVPPPQEVVDDSQSVPPTESATEQMVPLSALQDERAKRQELERRLESQEPEEDEYTPSWWDEMTRNYQSTTQAEPAPTQEAQQDFWGNYSEWFNEAMDSGDPMQRMNAISHHYNLMRTMEDQAESRARSLIPGYNELDVHSVPPGLIQEMQQNPKLLRAVAAAAQRSMGGNRPMNPTPNPTPPKPQTEMEKLQAQWVEEGAKRERDRIAQLANNPGLTGSTGGGTSPGGAPQDTIDEESMNYFRNRYPGKSDEELQVLAQRVVNLHKTGHLRSSQEYFGR